MLFIGVTLLRLWFAALLVAGLVGCGAIFNLISHFLFSGPMIDLDFTLAQYAWTWGGMYLATFVLDHF